MNNLNFAQPLIIKIKKLEKLVEEKNIVKIRAFLDDNISWNSKDTEFIQYCVNLALKVNGVFDICEKKQFKSKENWDREYLYYLQSLQLSEYSYDRYYHIIEVLNFLDDNDMYIEFKVNNDNKNENFKCKDISLHSEDKVNTNFFLAVGTGLLATTTLVLYLLRKRKQK